MEKRMKKTQKIKKCRLPKNHPDYYELEETVDRVTGKKRQAQVYPNLFNDLLSIPRKRK